MNDCVPNALQQSIAATMGFDFLPEIPDDEFAVLADEHLKAHAMMASRNPPQQVAGQTCDIPKGDEVLDRDDLRRARHGGTWHGRDPRHQDVRGLEPHGDEAQYFLRRIHCTREGHEDSTVGRDPPGYALVVAVGNVDLSRQLLFQGQDEVA